MNGNWRKNVTITGKKSLQDRYAQKAASEAGSHNTQLFRTTIKQPMTNNTVKSKPKFEDSASSGNDTMNETMDMSAMMPLPKVTANHDSKLHDSKFI